MTYAAALSLGREAIVIALLVCAPALLLGLLFAAQEGLNVAGIRRLADQAEPKPTA